MQDKNPKKRQAVWWSMFCMWISVMRLASSRNNVAVSAARLGSDQIQTLGFLGGHIEAQAIPG